MRLFFALAALFVSPVALADVGRSVPNRIATELALQAARIGNSSASIVTGETTWRSDDRGVVNRHGTVSWQVLDGTTVIEPTTDPNPTRSQFCSQVDGHDPVPGERALHLFRSDAPDPNFPNPGDQTPSLILGTGDAAEAVFATLKPGDQLNIVEAIRTKDGLRSEHMSIRRGHRTLSITRDGSSTRVCYAESN